MVDTPVRGAVVIVDAGTAAPSVPGGRVVEIGPRRVAEIEMTIVEVAAAIGASARAPEVVDDIQKPIEAVLAAAIDAPRVPVAFAARADPFTAGPAWIADMVRLAGGAPVDAASWDDVVAADPVLVVIAAPSAAGAPALAARTVLVDPGWYTLAGPRVGYGIVQLGFLLHPDRLVDPQLPLTEVET